MEQPIELKQESLIERTKNKLKNICSKMVSGTKSVFSYIKKKVFRKKEPEVQV